MTKPFDLTGRVVLVTGAGGGLGKHIAACFAQAGASVAVNDLNPETAKAVAAELPGAIAVAGDVTSEDGVDAIFEEIESQFGAVDTVVANATGKQISEPIENLTWEYFQSMVDFFIKSPYLLARRALPNMKNAGFGRIINIASEVFAEGANWSTAYTAAKGGQIGFTRSLSTEVSAQGITVNAVAPGFIPVERHSHLPKEVFDGYVATVPAGRFGEPQDIGYAAVFLATREAGFITGETIHVNGGRTPK
ncbi:MAG: 3-oxoacyl-[acyl-carrier-protein] reductase FabG [Actinomycetota bacterium]|jgi:3-oxoacyl-[acyl-carrier protein] reductase